MSPFLVPMLQMNCATQHFSFVNFSHKVVYTVECAVVRAVVLATLGGH